MKAGKELDALIAEKVMGWKVAYYPTIDIFEAYDEERNPIILGKHFSPSTNISDAWLVVEWLESNIGGISLESHCDERRYSFRVFNGTHWIVARAETAPLAICLAALKCVEGGNANE
ncbi:hypothetical protein WD019_15350 [Fictibacillus sp. Mic-4]|uniref:BC1872 family protein n=1 Tax=Fictibacillus sp. Mic-4 TaxID=3132826 RepID=UPI003CF4EC11